MDVVVQIRKIDKSGNMLKGINFPFAVPESEAPEGETIKHYGPQGFLRASTSISRDEARSSSDGQQVFYKFDRAEKISPGTVVPLEITFWPMGMGMVLAKGEGIKLLVAGLFLSEPANDAKRLKEPDDENIGQHYIDTGGKYDSHLILPIIAGNRA
ncbi:hypothetical protein MMC27_001313 [Xylographa pallens]|nr:hypothetical protein [Xylographa pallens]